VKKYFSPLKLKDYLSLVVLIIVGFGWLLIDQIVLPETYQRFIAFFILIFILYYFQFAINKPQQVIAYANSIAAITLAFIVIVSIVMHVIISHDFSFKSVLIWIVAGSLPYLTGLIYLKTRRK
jgi:hypothetical protein